MTEAPSVTTFVMGERLPWPDDAPVLYEQGPFEGGVVHGLSSRQECAIRKISALGATLRGELRGAPGETIAVELATGQRAAATIEWTSCGETGVRFAKAVDVMALINRKLISQSAERRAMPRVEIRCDAWVKRGADFLPAVVRNISAGGLQIEGGGLPPVGTYVAVVIDGIIVPPGEIAWRNAKLAGIQLLEELSWSSIMPFIRNLVRKPPQ